MLNVLGKKNRHLSKCMSCGSQTVREDNMATIAWLSDTKYTQDLCHAPLQKAAATTSGNNSLAAMLV